MLRVTIRSKQVCLTALMVAPRKKKPIDTSRMTRRLYMSESFPKMSVTKAETSAGKEIAQEYNGMPSNSSAILCNTL
jgi:hypothetical protein